MLDDELICAGVASLSLLVLLTMYAPPLGILAGIWACVIASIGDRS